MHLTQLFVLILASTIFSCNNTAPESNEVNASMQEMEEKQPEPIEIDSSFTLDYLRGHFNPVKHPDFVKVDPAYTDKEQTYYLHKQTWKAFKAMADAAKKDSIDLVLRSATRNFNRQKMIWEGKWTGSRLIEGGENAAKKYPDPKTRALKILLYSSMPGTSRHHWGTDIDLNSFVNSYFEKGKGARIYSWLTSNAASFGFCQPYTEKGESRPHGYEEERWHWSYLPLARQLTELAKRELNDAEITGFKGSEVAEAIGVVEKYVLGISHACQQ